MSGPDFAALSAGRRQFTRRRGEGKEFLLSDVRCRMHPGRDERCHFQVGWSINPHMDPQGAPVNLAEAERQVDGLHLALLEQGVEVTVLPFVHGAYDSVFIKDNALLVTDVGGEVRALLARPRFQERVQEQRARRRAFEALGFHVVDDPEALFEGGDTVMLPRRRGALLGYGFRSDEKAARAIARFIDGPVTTLELVDPALYHLDMVLTVLVDGTALVCREALAPASFEKLARLPSIQHIVEVPREEALAFGLNLIDLGDSVIVAAGEHHMAERLASLGRTPVVVPLGELQRAGGSAACLVARVHEAPRVADRRQSGARMSAAATGRGSTTNATW